MNLSLYACPRCHRPLAGDALRLHCHECGFALTMSEGLWLDNTLAQPPGFSPDRREHLSDIERDHFWFGPRDHLLAKLAARELPRGGNALELGCGSGRLLPAWNTQFAQTFAVESYARSLAEAQARDARTTLVQADVTRLPFADNQFDTVLAFDVLEHAPADAMLGEARRVARDGARFLLSVPAFQSLWSYADVAAGHRCRYDLAQLRGELVANGWRLLGHTHYQFALFPVLWLSRRLLGERGQAAERRPSRVATALLGRINALEVGLGAGLRLPYGTSLMAWAEAV
ncbi:class I SAM-dependent methyltransferase [Arenimonas oryziterrae]|uniref:Methyltransferase type 11 domain-containing protein n=1 Tax=Arenimonas oryziterrae DSM 21050 = YC6267 TaxID=1121015 RepID=A0A091AYW0_9GAMM|nr:class I SAM-dependent methyltransferase [Arenimonas oryziterrae]KFN44636.1 hypothetical protein N789_01100 [Arenimonas oryziterrae DSM 21050 = YC6267]